MAQQHTQVSWWCGADRLCACPGAYSVLQVLATLPRRTLREFPRLKSSSAASQNCRASNDCMQIDVHMRIVSPLISNYIVHQYIIPKTAAWMGYKLLRVIYEDF